MSRFVVWNEYKVENYSQLPATNLDELRLAEAAMDGCCSSEIEADDIGQFIEAVHNECDVLLKWAKLD